MSLKFSLKFVVKWMLLGLVVGGTFGAGDYFSRQRYDEKMGLRQQSFVTPAASIIGKPNQSLNVSVRHLDDLPENEDQILRLEVEIRTPLQFDSDIEVRWQLPDHVVAIESSTEPEKIRLLPGETWTRQISVRGLSVDRPAVIRVDASASIGGVSIGGQGLFSSHPLNQDLTRSALEPRPSQSVYRKAGTNDRTAVPRLPAGIQF